MCDILAEIESIGAQFRCAVLNSWDFQKYKVLGLVFFLGPLLAMAQKSPELIQQKVYSSDGKAIGVISRQLKKQSSPTDHLEENILTLHPDMAWQKEKEHSYQPAQFESSNVGIWNAYEVWDVNDLVNKTYNIILKFSAGDFRVIYSVQYGDLSVTPQAYKTEIVQTSGKNELLKKIKFYRQDKFEHHISLDTNKNPVVY